LPTRSVCGEPPDPGLTARIAVTFAMPPDPPTLHDAVYDPAAPAIWYWHVASAWDDPVEVSADSAVKPPVRVPLMRDRDVRVRVAASVGDGQSRGAGSDEDRQAVPGCRQRVGERERVRRARVDVPLVMYERDRHALYL
jgi:hypothetical protein